MNLSAMGVSLIGPFIGIDSPVTVIQMLWVNIIMDTLGGLAFAGEPALQSYMRRSAVPLETKLISPGMFGQILMTGSYTLALSIFFLKSRTLRAYFGGSDTYYLTAFFAMFIFCGIFNSFNVRTPSANLTRHLGSNKPFMLIMTLVACISAEKCSDASRCRRVIWQPRRLLPQASSPRIFCESFCSRYAAKSVEKAEIPMRGTPFGIFCKACQFVRLAEFCKKICTNRKLCGIID